MLRVVAPRVAVVVCWLAAAPLFAVDPAPKSDEKAVAPGERIRAIFDDKISMEVSDQPLFLALNQLREKTKINFVLDRFAIQQMGQDIEGMPVNVKIKDETVREALQKIVRPYNLSFAIIGDAVIVSTAALTTDRQLRQHIVVAFDKVEVAAALLRLKKETATNIVLDAAVEKDRAGKVLVTLHMDDVPLETAVRLLSEMAGLRAVREANVLKVTPRPQPEEVLDVEPKRDPPDGTVPPPNPER